MSASHLEPLPNDYLSLVNKSAVSHTTNLANVSTIISRLELAKSQLTQPSPPLSPGQESHVGALPSASDTLLPLSSFIKQTNANAAKESKEWGNAVNRFSKSVDKKFPGPPPPLFPPAPQSSEASVGTTAGPAGVNFHPSLLSLAQAGLDPDRSATGTSSSFPPPTPPPPPTVLLPFSTPAEIAALNSTIASHLARIGAFDTLDVFLQESETPSPLSPTLVTQLKQLHEILSQLQRGICTKAIEWVRSHPDRDPKRDLEFALRKEEFVRILLGRGGPEIETVHGEMVPTGESEMEIEQLHAGSHDEDVRANETAKLGQEEFVVQAALAYGGTHFRPLLTLERTTLICSLLTSPLFMPLSRLLSSPYRYIFLPYVNADPSSPSSGTNRIELELCAKFSEAYLESIGLPRESPLTVVTDVGGSGAMAKIMKVRNVMKEKRTEWSASGELPIEIPVPVQYRYHSIFSCPVSKEQSTETNPPMLLPCGHCIAKESLTRLARGTPTLKCPYCPVVSHVSACVRVHF